MGSGSENILEINQTRSDLRGKTESEANIEQNEEDEPPPPVARRRRNQLDRLLAEARDFMGQDLGNNRLRQVPNVERVLSPEGSEADPLESESDSSNALTDSDSDSDYIFFLGFLEKCM